MDPPDDERPEYFLFFLLNQKKCFTLQVCGTDRLEKMRPSIRCWTNGGHLVIFFFSGTLNRRPLLPFRLENRLPCAFRAEKNMEHEPMFN